MQPDDLDELGGMCTFTRSRQVYCAAEALALLPDEGREAERHSMQAVDAYSDSSAPDWAFGDQAGSHSALAIARIARGEIEGAAEALAPVLGLPAEQRINGIIHCTQRVSRALTSSPPAEEAPDLREQIDAFQHTPAAALPR